MQQQSNGYKWATWILVIIVIILGVMLAKKSNDTVSDTLGDLSDNVQECRMRLEEWNTKYPQGTSTNPAAQGELDTILEDCSDVVQGAQGEL